MGRLQSAFRKAEKENRAALVIYLCAGDPNLETTCDLVVAAAEAGADVIELGVPFSDPIADGVPIQRASERALAKGTTLRGVLDAVGKIRERTQVPIVLFGYFNPILAYGEADLVRDAKEKGVDGFLVVDLPPESAGTFLPLLNQHALDFIPLIAPTSTPARIMAARQAGSAFLYYISMTGVTGAQGIDLGEASSRAGELSRRTGLPVAVGFGIKTPEDVAKAARHTQGVVVGSAIVSAIEAANSDAQAVKVVRDLVTSLAAATQKA